MVHNIDELVRFRALTAVICSSICVSMIFCFGLVSDFLQNNYNYNQRELTTISTVGLVVGFFTFSFGIIFDYTGVLPLFIIGTVLTLLGPILFALTFAGVILPSVVRLSVYNAILNLGCGLFGVATVLALMDIFPKSRGPVIALVKTMTGLGSSVLAVIYDGFFNGKNANYMYFVIAIVLLFGPIITYCIRMPPYILTGYDAIHLSVNSIDNRILTKKTYFTKSPPIIRIIYGYVVVILLLLFLTIISILGAYINISQNIRMINAIVSIIIVVSFIGMAAPLKCMGGMEKKCKKDLNSPYNDNQEERVETGENDVSITRITSETEEQRDDLNTVKLQYSTTFWQGLLTIDVWCILWYSFWAWGAGLTMVLNVSQIYQALDVSADVKTTSLYVALNGVGSAVGRLAIGVVEPYLLRKEKSIINQNNNKDASKSVPLPITIAYPVGCFLLMIGYVLFLVLPGKAVVIAFFLTSCGYGYCAASTAVVVRLLWAKDSGKYYNLCFLGAMISAIALNRFLFAEIYDHGARRNGTYPKCVGRVCLQTTFIIIIVGCASAVVAGTLVHIRFMQFLSKSHEEERIKRNTDNNCPPACACACKPPRNTETLN